MDQCVQCLDKCTENCLELKLCVVLNNFFPLLAFTSHCYTLHLNSYLSKKKQYKKKQKKKKLSIISRNVDIAQFLKSLDYVQ